MKFRIERDALADAVAWSARSLPARPAAPVLAGLLLDVTDDQLSISGFDYEVSTHATLEVTGGTSGRALVSGRLLADISKSLPAHPVDVSADGSRVSITCGSAKFTLPTMPDEDYPRLPEMPTTAGTVSSSVFARAVAQVAVAAGKDDTLPMLTGVRMEIDGERVTLAATDRYRLAVRELIWTPANAASADAQVLVPARTLSDAAKSLTGDSEMTIALSASGAGEGIIGFAGTGRRTTTRLLDAQFPPYRTLLPAEFSVTAEVSVAALTEAVKRVALVADRGNPVRLDFTDGGLTLSAGGDDEGKAEENVEVDYSGDPITTAFNPAFLLEGLGAIEDPVARLLFTTPTKPAVIRPAGAAASAGGSNYTYLIMPVRLPG
ncbi:DNA polymerase III subunit beta [soil metagenome]|jgi:DNA polymerase-3 subunit beta